MYGEESKMFYCLVESGFSCVTYVKSDNDNNWKSAAISVHWLSVPLGAREYEPRTDNYKIRMCTLVLPFPEEDAENQTD